VVLRLCWNRVLFGHGLRKGPGRLGVHRDENGTGETTVVRTGQYRNGREQGRRTEEEGETMAKYRGGKVWLWGEGH